MRKPMLNFQGKVALVTGGSSGIGRAAAIAFAQYGAKVVVAARREEESQAVVAQIRQAGGDAHWINADMTNSDQIRSLIERTVEHYGRLDFAFNNAGTLYEA
jgi:NAD(P)-dependent dehydrogenase (short-subunit alcohol dehydrogenase family)